MARKQLTLSGSGNSKTQNNESKAFISPFGINQTVDLKSPLSGISHCSGASFTLNKQLNVIPEASLRESRVESVKSSSSSAGYTDDDSNVSMDSDRKLQAAVRREKTRKILKEGNAPPSKNKDILIRNKIKVAEQSRELQRRKSMVSDLSPGKSSNQSPTFTTLIKQYSPNMCNKASKSPQNQN